MPNNHTTWPFMTAVDFLHHENPPTWAGVEPATLGADDQRQANYATLSAPAELAFVAWGTLNSCQAANPLVRLWEGEERWEATENPQGVLHIN
ncbi:hypothetical protein TNCV_3167971 [Trichonephila clavipes]|uniref:Uncharacterized protein n=1 Tax=Trichonephila clavipes TaxID=2585209 RepID=A0A8X6RFZ7_TRICX|nr:hypothetical protein TNCV_3167971 [Trichonephila clavipes]